LQGSPFEQKNTIFIGDNFCGKSTLLETMTLKLNLAFIAGFYIPISIGRIVIDFKSLVLQGNLYISHTEIENL